MFYTPQARYEKMIEGFGGKGYFATTPDELASSLKEALAQRVPTIVNVAIAVVGLPQSSVAVHVRVMTDSLGQFPGSTASLSTIERVIACA